MKRSDFGFFFSTSLGICESFIPLKEIIKITFIIIFATSLHYIASHKKLCVGFVRNLAEGKREINQNAQQKVESRIELNVNYYFA
jgi:hypothetical protein